MKYISLQHGNCSNSSSSFLCISVKASSLLAFVVHAASNADLYGTSLPVNHILGLGTRTTSLLAFTQKLASGLKGL